MVSVTSTPEICNNRIATFFGHLMCYFLKPLPCSSRSAKVSLRYSWRVTPHVTRPSFGICNETSRTEACITCRAWMLRKTVRFCDTAPLSNLPPRKSSSSYAYITDKQPPSIQQIGPRESSSRIRLFRWLKMVADAVIYHPAVAHYNRFVATTSTRLRQCCTYHWNKC